MSISMNVPWREAEICGDSIVCRAPSEIFFSHQWEDIPAAIQNEIKENGPVPCGACGHIDRWCYKCRFAKIYDRLDDDCWSGVYMELW